MQSGLSLESDFDIRAFESADDTLSALRSSMKKPDVVLLDIRMPGKSGLMAIEDIKKISPKTKVLMLTMSGSRENVNATMKAGAFSYLQKTAGLDETVIAIRHAVNDKRYVDAASLTVLLDGFYPDDGGGSRYAICNREQQVLVHLAAGLCRKAIAEALEVCEETVKSHLKSIYSKLGVHKNSEAVRRAIEDRLV